MGCWTWLRVGGKKRRGQWMGTSRSGSDHLYKNEQESLQRYRKGLKNQFRRNQFDTESQESLETIHSGGTRYRLASQSSEFEDEEQLYRKKQHDDDEFGSMEVLFKMKSKQDRENKDESEPKPQPKTGPEIKESHLKNLICVTAQVHQEYESRYETPRPRIKPESPNKPTLKNDVTLNQQKHQENLDPGTKPSPPQLSTFKVFSEPNGNHELSDRSKFKAIPTSSLDKIYELVDKPSWIRMTLKAMKNDCSNCLLKSKKSRVSPEWDPPPWNHTTNVYPKPYKTRPHGENTNCIYQYNSQFAVQTKKNKLALFHPRRFFGRKIKNKSKSSTPTSSSAEHSSRESIDDTLLEFYKCPEWLNGH